MSKGNQYQTKFLNTFAAENIIGLFSRYKGSAKEITESWAMLEAAKKVTSSLSNTVVVVVGDGCSPRTGAMMAYYTQAEVISVDPNLNMDHWADHSDKQAKMGYPVRRLTLVKNRIENLLIDCQGKDCIVLFPHSHADCRQVYLDNYGQLSFISMPCCKPIPAIFQRLVHLTYDDEHVLSPKRTIHIWDSSDERFEQEVARLQLVDQTHLTLVKP